MTSLPISSVAIICVLCSVDVLIAHVDERNHDTTRNEDYIDAPFTIFEYDIRLTPHLRPSRPRFVGRVLIKLLCHRATNVVELHSKRLTVHAYSLTDAESRRPVAVYSFSQSAEKERIRLSTSEPLRPGGIYDLVVDYEGLFNRDGPTIGVFVVNYTDDRNSSEPSSRFMMGTTLRPNHARSLFPCVDSTDHKARFRVSVTREIGMKALSNTALARSVLNGDTATDTFETTEYLCPFHLVVVLFPVDDWVVSSSAEPDRVPSDLWMPRQVATYGQTALNYLERDIEFMEEYLDFPMPFDGIDFFAFKDYHTSAFEHPGLVTLKTTAIRKSKMESFDHTAKLVAHELGHQWFGNLVTAASWGDIWIAEGLTGLLTQKALRNHHAFFGEFAISNHVGQLLLMRNEKELTTLPLHQNFATKPTYEAIYHPLTWAKGQAVATLLEAYVGEETFRDVLRAVLSENRWGSLSVWDFLQHLESANEVFSAAAAWHWFADTGYPLVTVNSHRDRLTFKCYRLNGENDRSIWPVTVADLKAFGGPLKLSYVISYEDGKVKRDTLTFAGEEAPVTLLVDSDDFKYFMLNTDGLYARVLYDDTMWQKLIANIDDDKLTAHEKGVLSMIEDASVLHQYGMMDNEVFTALSGRYCRGHAANHSNHSHQNVDLMISCWKLWLI